MPYVPAPVIEKLCALVVKRILDMEETLNSLTNLVLTISLIAVVSVFVGHVFVRKALLARGKSHSSSKIIGSSLSVLLLLVFSFFFVIPR
jgi:hypothetical protein